MSSAEKLFQRMRRSKAGWTFDDVRRLYAGFGFEMIEGSKHTMYIHPKYPQLRATVTRGRSLAVGYITHAITLIEALKKMEQEEPSD